MKSPLSINHNIQIGKGDLELYHSVSVDGNVVIEETKGDSLVGNFLNILFSYAGGRYFPEDMYGHYDSSSNNYYSYSSDTITNAVSSGANTIITFAGSALSGAKGAQITGLVGDWEACNGFWIPVSTTSTTITIAVDSSLFGALDLGFSPVGIKLYQQVGDTYRIDLKGYGEPRIKVGTSTRAVALDDKVVISECLNGTGVNQFTHDTTSVAIPASDGSSVELSLSTQLVNGSGATIAIKEAGLYAYSYDHPSNNDYVWVLIARDLFTTSVADGKTVTVQYKITSSLDAQGGLTRQFLDILYTHLGSSYAPIDIEGATTSISSSSGSFMLAGGSGDNIQFPSYSGYAGQWIGVQVGTGSTTVTTDDTTLETRITHGDATSITVTAGTTGDLVISIDGTPYSETFSGTIAVTVSSWLSTHAATLAGLGTPITAVIDPNNSNAILLYRSASMTLVDSSTGDIAWTSAGRLRYYGQLVENWRYEDTPGEASFDVVRIFENATGDPITINETGLYAARQSSYADPVYCIARHVLTVPVTVAAGEIVKVTYTFSVSV